MRSVLDVLDTQDGYGVAIKTDVGKSVQVAAFLANSCEGNHWPFDLEDPGDLGTKAFLPTALMGRYSPSQSLCIATRNLKNERTKRIVPMGISVCFRKRDEAS